MDLAMPELDGIEATRQLRQRRAHSRTPIFAISAYATHDVKDDALAAGCTEVFSKPSISHHYLVKSSRHLDHKVCIRRISAQRVLECGDLSPLLRWHTSKR
jgi:CheY-like chemotaxis protein